MNLHIVNTGSAGNCYILTDSTGARLMIDCGVKFSEITKALGGKFSKVAGCLLTHEHGDHSMSAKRLMQRGIQVITPEITAQNIGVQHEFVPAHLLIEPDGRPLKLPFGYTVKAFSLKHDVPCVGYIIQHKECGTIIFATDTSELNCIFPEANHYIIEANYCMYVLAEQRLNGNSYLADRVENTHLSIQQAVRMLAMNDLATVYSVTLIHLSNANSDEGRFRDMVIEAVGKTTHVARPGMDINLSLPW